MLSYPIYRPAAELSKMKFNAPIEHTPILYINVKRKMGTFKLVMPYVSEMVRFWHK